MANEAALADHSRTIDGGVLPADRQEPSEKEFARRSRLLPNSVYARYTYFLRDKLTGLIKIGQSIEPGTRAQNIGSALSTDIELLATIRCGTFERAYHNAFAAHRLHGEWFAPHPDILAEIERWK